MESTLSSSQWFPYPHPQSKLGQNNKMFWGRVVGGGQGLGGMGKHRVGRRATAAEGLEDLGSRLGWHQQKDHVGSMHLWQGACQNVTPVK